MNEFNNIHEEPIIPWGTLLGMAYGRWARWTRSLSLGSLELNGGDTHSHQRPDSITEGVMEEVQRDPPSHFQEVLSIEWTGKAFLRDGV